MNLVRCVLLCYIVNFQHFNVLFVQTVSHYVALAGLELRSMFPCLPSYGIKGMCHHTQFTLSVFICWYLVWKNSKSLDLSEKLIKT